jgi:hypothetical protein
MILTSSFSGGTRHCPADATRFRSGRGLTRGRRTHAAHGIDRCNTVPIEKGTETIMQRPAVTVFDFPPLRLPQQIRIYALKVTKVLIPIASRIS